MIYGTHFFLETSACGVGLPVSVLLIYMLYENVSYPLLFVLDIISRLCSGISTPFHRPLV